MPNRLAGGARQQGGRSIAAAADLSLRRHRHGGVACIAQNFLAGSLPSLGSFTLPRARESRVWETNKCANKLVDASYSLRNPVHNTFHTFRYGAISRQRVASVTHECSLNRKRCTSRCTCPLAEGPPQQTRVCGSHAANGKAVRAEHNGLTPHVESACVSTP